MPKIIMIKNEFEQFIHAEDPREAIKKNLKLQ